MFAVFAHEGPEVTYPGSVHNAEVYLHRPPKDRNDWHVRFAGPAIKIFNKMRASVSTGQNSAQNGSVASLGVLSAGKKGGPAVGALPVDFCLATSCTPTGEGRPADHEWTKPQFIALCQFMLKWKRRTRLFARLSRR